MKNQFSYRSFVSTCLILCAICYAHVVFSQGNQSQSTVKIAPSATTGAWLHLPDDYAQTSDNYPLLIFLHGVSDGSTLNTVLAHGVPRIISKGANMQFTVGGKLYKFIVVSPQIPDGWANEKMVQSVIDDMKAKYRVDASRIYLTGLSAGGYGVLNYVASGSNYASNLAAIVPVSSAPIDAPKLGGLCNIATANLGTWMLCGSTDNFAGYQTTYTSRIQSCNPSSKPLSTFYAGGGHDDGVWDRAYDATHTYQNPNIYEWMLQFRQGGSTPAPVARVAASNIAVTLPVSTATLDGTASSASNGSISTFEWKQESGPATATIATPGTARTTVSNLKAGTYVFSLTVTDNGGLKASTNVTVQVTAVSSGGCGSCKFLITKGADGGAYINGNNLNVQPGDTVCIQAGDYSYMQFFNFSGTGAKPIVFINCGGQVKIGNGGNYGLVFNNVKYFKVTGSGSSQKYGFVVNGVSKKLSSGLAIGKGCTDYEAERFEITGSEVGVMAKVNPDCETENQAPYFEIRNVKLHDLYIHDVIGEGMYIGNTAPGGTETVCNGNTMNLLPPRIHNLKIYNVTTQNTGWDGIQVASAPENVEIFNNKVYNYGTTNKGSQQAGIILGGLSNGKVYNNTVIKGTGNGIELFGTGLSYIYNNIVVDAGRDGTAVGQDAIFIDDRPTKPDYTPLQAYVFNNTVVNAGRDGIRMQNSFSTVAKGNLFYNNLTVNCGSAQGTADYLNVQAGIDAQLSNNVALADINAAKFVDVPNNDFHLATGSPAIDKGKDLSAYFKTDIDGDARPSGAAWDIGADEYTGATPANKPPVASAGNDITITLPVSATTLDGTDSYDPDGSIAAYKWTQVSGPATAGIASSDQAQTGVSGLVTEGTYVFELTVTDNKGATDAARVTVVVKPRGAATLIANAGKNQEIRLPDSTVTLDGTGSSVSYGRITSYTWKLQQGPASVQILDPGAAQTPVTFTVPGVYYFMLTVTDDNNNTASAVVIITVKKNDEHPDSTNKLTIFPNPVNNTLQLRLSLISPAYAVLRILAGNGAVMSTINLGQVSDLQRSLDVSFLPCGVYFLHVTDGDALKIVKKFIKIY